MAKTKNFSTCKRINAVVEDLIKNDWMYLGNSKHGRLRSPSGKVTITIPGSPSDHRASLNWISQVRRAGAFSATA